MPTRTLLLLLLLTLPLPAVAKEPPKAKDRDAAIHRAMAWLDKNLSAVKDVQGTPEKQFTYAVAGLVYLMSPNRSSGADPVQRIRKYLDRYVDSVLERSEDPSQLPARHGLATSSALTQYNWPIAMAGVFYAELYVRGKGKGEALTTLKKIVRILEASQQSNGGWGHGRISKEEGKDPLKERLEKELGDKPGARKLLMSGYPNTLVSSTNVVASALGIIAAAIGKAKVTALDEAAAHLDRARLEDGSYPYDTSQRSAMGSTTNVGRTAGAVFALHWLGYTTGHRGFKQSVDFLLSKLELVPEAHGSASLSVLHGALATHALGDDEFQRFRALHEKTILDHQEEDGSFTCICIGDAFAVTCDTDPFGKARARGGVSKRAGNAELGSLFARGKHAYITAIYTFVLLLERDGLKVLKKKPVKRRVVRTETPRRGK